MPGSKLICHGVNVNVNVNHCRAGQTVYRTALYLGMGEYMQTLMSIQSWWLAKHFTERPYWWICHSVKVNLCDCQTLHRIAIWGWMGVMGSDGRYDVMSSSTIMCNLYTCFMAKWVSARNLPCFLKNAKIPFVSISNDFPLNLLQKVSQKMQEHTLSPISIKQIIILCSIIITTIKLFFEKTEKITRDVLFKIEPKLFYKSASLLISDDTSNIF